MQAHTWQAALHSSMRNVAKPSRQIIHSCFTHLSVRTRRRVLCSHRMAMLGACSGDEGCPSVRMATHITHASERGSNIITLRVCIGAWLPPSRLPGCWQTTSMFATFRAGLPLVRTLPSPWHMPDQPWLGSRVSHRAVRLWHQSARTHAHTHICTRAHIFALGRPLHVG